MASKKNNSKTDSQKGCEEVIGKNEALEEELKDMSDLLKRTQADFINFKSRSERERSESVNFGKVQAILEFVPIYDNLRRAQSHSRKI
jgi:molecular chaperone GrpE